MIAHNHPAVEAAARDAYERAWGTECEPWDEASDLERNVWRADEAHALTTALPHLESATEENLARLRGTPAGKQLLAEGWEAACRKVIRMAWADSSDAEYLADEGNPYRQEATRG